MPTKTFNATYAADIAAEENAGLVITITALGANGYEISMVHPTIETDDPSLKYRRRKVANMPAGFKNAADSELAALLAAAGYV